jgi:hypothetical protein
MLGFKSFRCARILIGGRDEWNGRLPPRDRERGVTLSEGLGKAVKTSGLTASKCPGVKIAIFTSKPEVPI